MTHPDAAYADLMAAFIRGRLPQHAHLPLDELVAVGRAAGLSLHKFKRKSGPPRVTRVLGLLQGLAPADLLDIGPGRGAFLWPFLGRFPQVPVTSVDCLEHRVRDIEAVRVGGIERVQAQLGDVAALDFEDDAFDITTILEVLEHLPDPAPAAREVLRVTRRFVVASVPSQPDDNPEHLRLFTKASLTALFEQAGATRVAIEHVRGHMIATAR